MNYAVQHITLDIEKAGSQAYVVCRKGDTARSIAIHLVQGGKPYPVAAGTHWVWCGGKNISGTTFLNACTVENGIAVYNLSSGNTSMAGQFDIAVYVADREMEEERILHLEAPVFTVVVAASKIDTTAAQETEEWTALEQMLATGLAEVTAEVDQSIGEANVTVTSEVLEKSGRLVHFAFTGIKGEQGIQGVQGVKGDKGEKGEKGDTGPQGEQGAQGVKGDKGEAGAQGIQGEKGDKGDTGAQGLQGIQGEKGEKGDTGEKGEKGDTGAQGIQGVQGVQGIQGEKGDTGDSGVYVGTDTPATGIKVWVNPDGENTFAPITDAQIDALFE